MRYKYELGMFCVCVVEVFNYVINVTKYSFAIKLSVEYK